VPGRRAPVGATGHIADGSDPSAPAGPTRP
jgi:hypothetical protein